MNIKKLYIFNRFKNFIEDNKLMILLFLFGLIFFYKYIVLIFTFIFLGFISLNSIKISRVVPHISVETVGASSVLISYVWGWKFGLAFALIIGNYGYAREGILKFKSIVNVLLMGVIAVVASIFHTLNYSFLVSYMLSFIIRMILNAIIFPMIESDMLENIIHGFGDPIFNMLITFQLMNLYYIIIKMFI